MKSCGIGFSINDSWFSYQIARKIGKPYSHVFLLFECNGHMLVFHATRRGVNVTSYEQFLKHNKVVKLIEVVDPEKVSNAFSYCVSKLNTPYGFLAILAIGLGIHYQDGEKTLICSEYVANAMGYCSDKLSDLITPVDLEKAYDVKF